MQEIIITKTKTKLLCFEQLKIAFPGITCIFGDMASGKSLLVKGIERYCTSLVSLSSSAGPEEVTKMMPSLFTMPSKRGSSLESIAKTLSLHKSIVKLFLDNYKQRRCPISEFIDYAQSVDNLDSLTILAEIYISKPSNIENILSCLSNIKCVAHNDLPLECLLSDVNYNVGDSIKIKMPHTSTLSRINIERDTNVLLKHSNVIGISVLLKEELLSHFAGAKSFSSQAQSSSGSTPFIVQCALCKGQGFVKTRFCTVSEALSLTVKEIMCFLEEAEASGIISTEMLVKFIGNKTRLQVNDYNIIGALEEKTLSEFMKEPGDKGGLSYTLHQICTNGTKSKNTKNCLSKIKTCSSCQGSGLDIASLVLCKVGRHSIQSVFSMNAKEIKVFASKHPHSEQSKSLADACNTLIELSLGTLKINRMLQSLSYGENKRIVIAKSFLCKVTGCILVFDSILVGLDERSQQKALKIIEAISKNKNCVIITCTSVDKMLAKYSDYFFNIQGKQAKLVAKKTAIQQYPVSSLKEAIVFKIFPSTANALQILKTNTPTSIYGESGSGKTRFIHEFLIPTIIKTSKSKNNIFVVPQTRKVFSPVNRVVTFCDIYPSIQRRIASSGVYNQSPFLFSLTSQHSLICKDCRGLGHISPTILGSPMKVLCIKCSGSGWQDEHKKYKILNQTINDILKKSAKELRDFLYLANMDYSASKVQTLIDIGGENVCVGSLVDCLSDGEYKLVSIASWLNKIKYSKARDIHLVLDEPTNYISRESADKTSGYISNLIKKKAIKVISFHSHSKTFIESENSYVIKQ